MSEIVKHQKAEIESLPIKGMQDLAALGDFIAQSGMLGVASPAAGLVVAATCVQERMSLLEFGRRYHVDNRGKVTMRSDRMLAEFMEMGGTCKWVSDCDDKTEQRALFSYGVNKDYPVCFKYQEAVDAGYIKKGSNWEKDPASQMRARVITRGIRMVCPGAVAGVYTPDEMQDVYETEHPRNTDPKPVSPDEVKNLSFEVPEKVTFEETDYSVCPIKNCEFTDKKWSDIDTDSLKQALTLQSMGITDGHIVEIKKELNKRESE